MLDMAAGYEAMFQADIVLTFHLILFDKCRIVNFLLQTDFMYHVSPWYRLPWYSTL